MGQTYNFAGSYYGGTQLVSFTGTPDPDDVLVATFESESSAGGSPLVTDFTQHADGSFTATYRTQQNGAIDSVTISGIENVHIYVTNTYMWQGNEYHTNTPDNVRTGHGDDIIWTYYGPDTIDAGLGVDEVNGGDGTDGLAKDFGAASAGVDINLYDNTFAGAGSYTNLEYFIDLKTGSGNDRIDTTAVGATDVIHARAGNDIVTVRNGQDTVALGGGKDRLVVDWREANFTNNTFMTLEGPATGYSGTLAGIHSGAPSVDFSGVEHFTVHTMVAGGNGSNLRDTIVTGDGNDVVFTYASNDLIHVGRGVDRVDGGVGIDGLAKDFGSGTARVNFNLYGNAFSGSGDYTNLEYFIDLKTGNGNDRVDTTVAAAADLVTTRGGNDIVTVRNGQDTVDLGGGNDRLVVDWREASFTNNTFMTLGGSSAGYSGAFAGTHSGAPSVEFNGVEHFTIYTKVEGGNGSNLKDQIVTGDGNDFIYTYASNDSVQAGGGNDVIDGGVGNDVLDGGDGADDLRGGSGNDWMIGGAGNDRFFIDSSSDVAVEEADGGKDTVFAQASFTLGANVEILRLQGTGDLSGTGNDLDNLIFGTVGANILRGLDGADRLMGNDGADTLDGGAGNDTLSGGSQADVFQFAAAAAGADRITDFNKNADRFDLSGGSFSNVSLAPNGDAILTHGGGTIRVEAAPSLTLAQWNALVLPAGGGSEGLLLSDAWHTDDRLNLAQHLMQVGSGDWAYA